MRSLFRHGIVSLLVLTCTVSGGCTVQYESGQPLLRKSSYSHSAGYSKDGKGRAQNGSMPVQMWDNVEYVSGNDVARLLEFRTKWDAANNKFRMGDYDAAYEWTVNSVQAERGGITLTLPDAPVLKNSLVYLPVLALGLLFQDEVSFERNGNKMVLHTTQDDAITARMEPVDTIAAPDWNFADDPNDPFKEIEEGAAALGDELLDLQPGTVASVLAWTGADIDENDAIPAVSRQVNLNELIANAERYLGVEYDFAAPPYPQSGRFDCSSYTQYVFARHGISLASSARGQALQGVEVDKKQLRKGDLLFFHVPGRYRSAATIGQVGIYMGRQKMIHAAPVDKQGVQITDIDTPYWKRTFVKAMRVANNK